MEVKKRGFVQRIKWIFKLIKKGLFWQGVRNNLAKIGIDLMPYYWSKITFTDFTAPKIRLEEKDLVLSFFGEEEIKFIKSNVIGIENKDFFKYLENGERCLGLKCGNEIVAYMFIRQKSFYFRKRFCDLGDNASYIHSMYVFDKFRGKNIAAYLRHQCLKLLFEEGVKNHYAITEYFNKSALKYQKKLNASKRIALILSVIIFNKWYKNITIKKYM